MSAVPDSFYAWPEGVEEIMTAAEYRSCLKESNGRIVAHGKSWYILGKSLGAGMYRVSLKERK